MSSHISRRLRSQRRTERVHVAEKRIVRSSDEYELSERKIEDHAAGSVEDHTVTRQGDLHRGPTGSQEAVLELQPYLLVLSRITRKPVARL